MEKEAAIWWTYFVWISCERGLTGLSAPCWWNVHRLGKGRSVSKCVHTVCECVGVGWREEKPRWKWQISAAAVCSGTEFSGCLYKIWVQGLTGQNIWPLPNPEIILVQDHVRSHFEEVVWFLETLLKNLWNTFSGFRAKELSYPQADNVSVSPLRRHSAWFLRPWQFLSVLWVSYCSSSTLMLCHVSLFSSYFFFFLSFLLFETGFLTVSPDVLELTL